MKKLKILFMILVSVSLFGCSSRDKEGDVTDNKDTKKTTTNTYQKITPQQAKIKIDEESAYILLDVRTDEEFEENRIEGAICIPDVQIKSRAEVELTDKNALILVYCRSGRRSEAAAKELIALGYNNVYDFGGIIDWPYDTISN